MSRIGKKPVEIKAGVTVTKESDTTIVVKGPKGELKFKPNPKIEVKVEEAQVLVIRDGEGREQKALQGLTRSLIQNMVVGVTDGYQKTLEINGVGYKVAVQGQKLVLNLGFSHPINYPVPKGIEFKVDDEKKNVLYVKSIDKQLLGQVCAEIRAYRPPEPYKGKGIKYEGEYIRRKAGKSAAKAA